MWFEFPCYSCCAVSLHKVQFSLCRSSINMNIEGDGVAEPPFGSCFSDSLDG